MEQNLIVDICMIGTFSDISVAKQSEAQAVGATLSPSLVGWVLGSQFLYRGYCRYTAPVHTGEQAAASVCH